MKNSNADLALLFLCKPYVISQSSIPLPLCTEVKCTEENCTEVKHLCYMAFTSSNSLQISSSGALVRRLTTTMKMADTANAGASS